MKISLLFGWILFPYNPSHSALFWTPVRLMYLQKAEFPPVWFSFVVLQESKMSPFGSFDLQTTLGVGRFQQCLLHHLSA